MSMFHELMMRKKEETLYPVIKGTLTDTDGIISGFNTTNYLALQQPFTLSPTTKAEIVIKTKPTEFVSGTSVLGTFGSYGVSLQMTGLLHLYLGDGSAWNIINNLTGTTTLSVDTDYWVKIIIDNGNVSLLLSTDGITYTTEATTTISISQSYNYNLTYGIARIGATYFRGSIDLTNSYIKLGSTKYNLQAVVGYTIVGSPTIVDGVVSGFSASDYLTIPKSINPVSENIKTIELFSKITTSNTISSSGILCSGSYGNGALGFIVSSSRPTLMIYYYNGTTNKNFQCNSSIILQPNTTYYLKGYIDIQTGKCEIQVSTDGINYTLTTRTPTDFVSIVNYIYTYRIGQAQNGVFSGSIDLNETYIKINNKLWFNGKPS